MDKINCRVKDPKIKLPKYETEDSAGMDLRGYYYCTVDDLNTTYDIPNGGIALLPQERILIKTGLFMAIPRGYEAQIRPRSGLALKHGITVLNSPATIDCDYRGEIGVILINTSDTMFIIEQGDRIAQMVINKVEQFELSVADELDDTARGTGGFGSTNKA